MGTLLSGLLHLLAAQSLSTSTRRAINNTRLSAWVTAAAAVLTTSGLKAGGSQWAAKALVLEE
jgi:low temperature requirement protein LtrA